MTRPRVLVVSSSVLALTLLAAEPALAATWTTVPVAAVGTQSTLAGVDLLSSTDGWAVGGAGSSGGVTERWNGSAWTLVASPDILDHRGTNNYAGLGGVDAVSASSAFAVGFSASYSYGDGVQHVLPIAERWNGSAWAQQTVPVPSGNYDTELDSVKAFSANDVWAVGHTGTMTRTSTFAVHFDGTSWTQLPTPSPGTKNNVLTTIAGAASNDIWAFGYTHELPYGNRARNKIALHWNGSAWSQSSLPDNGASQTFLYSAAAVSGSNVWVTGYSSSAATGVAPVIFRWNGSAWSSAPGPALQTLRKVTALSANDVWVSGSDANGLPSLANWNGSAWSLTAVPTAGGLPYTSIAGLASVSPGTVHAVGITSDQTTGISRPIALRTANG